MQAPHLTVSPCESVPTILVSAMASEDVALKSPGAILPPGFMSCKLWCQVYVPLAD